MRFQPMPILTGFTLVSLVILIILGSWQWARFEEKRGREVAPPPVFEEMTLYRVAEAQETQEVYGLYRGQSVWRRYVPVSLEKGGPASGVMLLDMVVSVDPVRENVSRREGFRANFIALPPEEKRGAFTGKDDPEAGRWFVVSASAMLERWGISDRSETLQRFEPETIYGIDLDGRFTGSRIFEAGNPWADPKLADDLPPVRHLGYAITWWGLALALIGVYIAYHVSRDRLSFRKSGPKA